MTKTLLLELAQELCDMGAMGMEDLTGCEPYQNADLTVEESINLMWFMRGAAFEKKQRRAGNRPSG